MNTFARFALFAAFSLQAVVIGRADPAPTKSAKDCNEELALNKAAIEASGETPQAFFHRCWWESEPGKPTPIKTARASWDPGRSPAKKAPHPKKVANEEKAPAKTTAPARHANVPEPPARPEPTAAAKAAAAGSSTNAKAAPTATAQAERAPELPAAKRPEPTAPADVAPKAAAAPEVQARPEHTAQSHTTPSLFGRKYVAPTPPPQEDQAADQAGRKIADTLPPASAPPSDKTVPAPAADVSHPGSKAEAPSSHADKVMVRPRAAPPSVSPKVVVTPPPAPAAKAAEAKHAETKHAEAKSVEPKAVQVPAKKGEPGAVVINKTAEGPKLVPQPPAKPHQPAPVPAKKGEPVTVVINKTAEGPKLAPQPPAKPLLAKEAKPEQAKKSEHAKTTEQAKKTEEPKSTRDAKTAPEKTAGGKAAVRHEPRQHPAVVAIPATAKPLMPKTETRILVSHEPGRHHRPGHVSRPLPIAEEPIARPTRERVRRAAYPVYLPHAAPPRRTAMARVPAGRLPMGPVVCIYAQPDALGRSPCVPVPMP